MGLLSEEAMARVFGKNHRVDFFHLDGRFYPKETSQVLSIDTVLKYGVLPLGFKSSQGLFSRGRTLNLGMLDPARKDFQTAAEQEIQSKERFDKTRVFLILADQYLEVLQSVYGMSQEDIARRPSSAVEPTLAMFLGGKGVVRASS